jgi:ribosome-binding protein aMBF1 (putative translation factor)
VDAANNQMRTQGRTVWNEDDFNLASEAHRACMTTLGDTIFWRRQRAGMSLRDLADAAGCTHTHIRDLERGASRNPTIRVLVGLARALGVPPARLAAAAICDHET